MSESDFNNKDIKDDTLKEIKELSKKIGKEYKKIIGGLGLTLDAELKEKLLEEIMERHKEE
jgi:uncharacterized metal-binding protein